MFMAETSGPFGRDKCPGSKSTNARPPEKENIINVRGLPGGGGMDNARID